MSQVQTASAALPMKTYSAVTASTEAVAIPWAIGFMLVGTSCSVVGAALDVASHMSIGRDSFWTPGHVLTQMEGLLAGIACLYTILTTTFASTSMARGASVQILGFRAPVGAFMGLWGFIAMLASAPLDNWWHNAYGLDTKLVTPPHLLLSLGGFVIKTGTLAWAASLINRSSGALRGRLQWVLLIVGAICVTQLAGLSSGPWLTLLRNMHTARCYLAIAIFVPTMLIATRWGSAHKWGCTIIAALCMSIALATEWLLPLIPAQPKLGPVYHNVTHLIPYGFPLLLIVPAFIADILLQRLEQRSFWIKALWVGPTFVLSLMAVQWPFANFLMSPASRNWIFGTAYFAYGEPAGVLFDPYKFNVVEKTPAEFVLTVMAALLVSVLTTRLGLSYGNWMRRVQR